jgi:membrane protein YdbS with pleckstrin-like domain
VVVRRTSIVPYRRVQQIDLSRGPLDRLLGLTTAGITTAAATTDGGVPGLVPEVADRFRQVVLERAGRDDAV